MAVCAISCYCAFLFLIICLQMPGISGFIPLLVVGFVALFSINAVVRAAIMWSVPVALRSMACSVDTVIIHVFGDIPAPPIFGAIEDQLSVENGPGSAPGNWRVAMSAGVAPLLGAAIIFTAAAVLARLQDRKGAALAALPGSEDGMSEDQTTVDGRTTDESDRLRALGLGDGSAAGEGHGQVPAQLHRASADCANGSSSRRPFA